MKQKEGNLKLRVLQPNKRVNMTKIVLDTVSSGYNLGKINANFEKLETELNDKVLYRDQTATPNEPNELEQDLDLNSNRILNLPAPIAPTEPLRKGDITSDETGATVQYVDDSVSAVQADVDNIPTDIINDLSQTYEFPTVAAYEAFATAFPVGKVIHLLDRNAEFTVIAGTGTADTYGTIASTLVAQSITITLGMVINYRAFGAVADAETTNTDNSGAINAAHQAGTSNWEIYQGEAGVYGCQLILPKQRQTIRNTQFKHWGNNGSASAVSHIPVVRLGDGITDFNGFTFNGVDIDGNRAAFSNINILGGADGGMHGLHIHGKVTDVTYRDGSLSYAGTAGVALDWAGTKPPSTDAPVYTIRNILFDNVTMDYNRESGSFATYFKKLTYRNCKVRNNGIDLAGGPWPEEDGSHGAFITANGYFSRGINIEAYHSQSGYTEVEVLGCEITGNANGSLQFYDPTAMGGNRIGSENCVVSNTILEGPTVGTASWAFFVQAGNPLNSVYGMEGLYLNNVTIKGRTSINGASGLHITGSQSGTIDPVKSIEVYNSRRISTSIPVTSQLLLNDIEAPTVTVSSGVAAVPALQSIDYGQPVGGVCRLTYKYKVTGGGGADGDNNKFKVVWTDGLPPTQKRQPAMYSVLHSAATTDPASYSPVAVEGADGEVYMFVKGTTGNNNLTFYLTVNVISGKEP